MQLRRGSRVPSSRARTLTGRDKGCWLHSHRCALIVKGPRRVSSGTPLGTRVRVHYKGLTAFADGTWPLQPAEGLDALAVAPMWLMRTFPFPCLLLVLRPLVARARGTGAGFCRLARHVWHGVRARGRSDRSFAQGGLPLPVLRHGTRSGVHIWSSTVPVGRPHIGLVGGTRLSLSMGHSAGALAEGGTTPAPLPRTRELILVEMAPPPLSTTRDRSWVRGGDRVEEGVSNRLPRSWVDVLQTTLLNELQEAFASTSSSSPPPMLPWLPYHPAWFPQLTA